MNNIPLSKSKQENYLKQGKYQFTCPLQTANLHNRSFSAPGHFIFTIPVSGSRFYSFRSAEARIIMNTNHNYYH